MRVVAIAVLALSMGLGWLALRDSSLFQVDSVTIEGLPPAVQPVVAEELAAAARDQTTTDFSVAALRRQLAQYTLIAGVRAETHFPHGVTLIVRARRAVARIDVDGSAQPVDEHGLVITGLLAATHLPTVEATHMAVGGMTHDAFALLALRVLSDAPAPLRSRVVAVTAAEGLTIYLHAGPRLIFGNGQRPHAKWDSATAVLATSSSRGAAYINVTLPSRPAAQIGDGATSNVAAAGSASAASMLSGAPAQP